MTRTASNILSHLTVGVTRTKHGKGRQGQPAVGRRCYPKNEQRRNNEQALQPCRTTLAKDWQ